MNTQKGFGMMGYLALIGIIVIGGIGYALFGGSAKTGDAMMESDAAMQGDSMEKEGDAMMDDGSAMKDTSAGAGSMEGRDGGAMMEDGVMEGAMMDYQGTVLAGTASPFLDFTQADYDAALASGKPILLYFYANWCPTCKAEIPVAYEAFNALHTGNVIGFRVNYNDNETDAAEKALAKQFGVAYQHTKVWVVGGTLSSKSPESWNAARYQKELAAH